MVGYFASLAGAFYVVRADVAERRKAQRGGGGFAGGMYQAAFVALLVTWYQIVSWLVEDTARYVDVATWVRDADLFVEAYRLVTLTSAHWFWSCQLLTLVAPWVLYVSLSARDVPIHVSLSYIWLGFAGAISVSMPLHFVRNEGFVLPRFGRSEGGGQILLWLLLAAAVVSCALLPGSLQTEAFGWVLGTLHIALLLVPFAVKYASGLREETYRGAMYIMAGTLAMVYWYNVVVLLQTTEDPMGAVVAAVTSNRCQASITYDLFCVCTLVAVVLVRQVGVKGLLWVAAVPVVSPGAVVAGRLATL